MDLGKTIKAMGNLLENLLMPAAGTKPTMAPPLPHDTRCPCDSVWRSPDAPTGWLEPEPGGAVTTVYTLNHAYPATPFVRLCQREHLRRTGGGAADPVEGCAMYWTGRAMSLHRHTRCTTIHHELFHFAWDLLVKCRAPGLEAARAMIETLYDPRAAIQPIGSTTFRDAFWGFLSRQDEVFNKPCPTCPRIWHHQGDNMYVKAVACEAVGSDGMALPCPISSGRVTSVDTPDDHSPTVRRSTR